MIGKTQCTSSGGDLCSILASHIHTVHLNQPDDITGPVWSSEWQQWALRQDVTTLGTSAETKFSLNYTSVKTGNNSGEFFTPLREFLPENTFAALTPPPPSPALSSLHVQHSFIAQSLFLARYVQRTRRKTQGPLVLMHSWLELVHYVPQSQNVGILLSI